MVVGKEVWIWDAFGWFGRGGVGGVNFGGMVGAENVGSGKND